MARIRTRILSRIKGDVTTVKALVKHPMTGTHFIKEITFEHQGKVIMSANWGMGISSNPYFSFKFKGGNKGEPVKLSWKDNKDHTGEIVKNIK
ncbi:thiosulfate oxidation carrier complex protein SoxZ [Candidatus Marithrix sp. Canyon 246]|uniref:thiosulfate oxidation carrier complex protein SoxZ n=1 Tax=Candidatus Marithrix sp. Canyon 246 TaxID=1827136 RepID=UPI000849F9B1|nr:thiosulfate oxidation carrier complex protein SoxZ [Candidatus Marithrix sp. Canyon 246]